MPATQRNDRAREDPGVRPDLPASKTDRPKEKNLFFLPADFTFAALKK